MFIFYIIYSYFILFKLFTRLKDVAQAQYSQGEADWSAGMSKEILPPVHNIKHDNEL